MRFLLIALLVLISPTHLFSQEEGFEFVNPPITIVVLGSSTAAGAGTSPIDNAWVNRYRRYVQGFNPNNQVINLAKGGYNSYHLMPSDAAVPSNRMAPDTVRNITKALQFKPDGLIINLPSNDISNGYSVKEQLDNFRMYAAFAEANNIELWITTTQPRNFPKERDRLLQVEVKDSLERMFGDHCIDFWRGFADNSLNVVKEYDSGDGCHLNNEGHRILKDRVIASQAFRDLLNYSSIQRDISIENQVELSPHMMEVGFRGMIESDSSASDEMRFVKIVQRDRTLNAANVIEDAYKIETIVDLSHLVEVKFEAPNSLTKIVVFDLSTLEKQEGDDAFVYYPVESIDIEQIPLSELNYRFPNNQIVVAQFDFNEDERRVNLDREHVQFQLQRIEDASIFSPEEGKKLVTYWENGNKKAIHQFKNGQLNCKSTWYSENGTKVRVVYFKNGAYNGKYITFDSEGKKKSLRKFKHDEQVGETKEF